jgi:hypothetical protein
VRISCTLSEERKRTTWRISGFWEKIPGAGVTAGVTPDRNHQMAIRSVAFMIRFL